MKLCVALFALLAVSATCHARLRPYWTYEMLTAGADLVVIATPTETKDTDKTVFPGLVSIGAAGKVSAVPAVGIETKFKVLAVLKGGKNLKGFVLYHLREVNKPGRGSPETVSFAPKEQRRYLLFLKRQADGRFGSVTGQIDPVYGIKDLGLYP
jgi:hypothetical protein